MFSFLHLFLVSHKFSGLPPHNVLSENLKGTCSTKNENLELMSFFNIVFFVWPLFIMAVIIDTTKNPDIGQKLPDLLWQGKI